MKLIVLTLLALLSIAKSQDGTSETTVAPIVGVSEAVTSTPASSEATTSASVSQSTTTQVTTDVSDNTTTSTMTTISANVTSPSSCRDSSPLCSSFKQLCQVPERCRRPIPIKSGSKSDESGSESDESGSRSDESDSSESGSGEKDKNKSKNGRIARSIKSKNARIARSTETELDDDELACNWTRQQNDPELRNVTTECATDAPQLQLQGAQPDGGVDNGLGRDRPQRGGPKRPPLDCLFREIISKFFRRICPVTCGVCRQ